MYVRLLMLLTFSRSCSSSSIFLSLILTTYAWVEEYKESSGTQRQLELFGAIAHLFLQSLPRYAFPDILDTLTQQLVYSRPSILNTDPAESLLLRK